MKPAAFLAVMVLFNADACAAAGDTYAYHDGAGDGKRSLGGSGEAIRFELKGKAAVSGVRVHCSRYGTDVAPRESALLYVLNDTCDAVLHTELVPYSAFPKGEEKWLDIPLRTTVEVQGSVWVVMDFRAGQTKGVYVTYDTSTNGRHSRSGLPGLAFQDVDTGGDWMIELKTVKAKTRN